MSTYFIVDIYNTFHLDFNQPPGQYKIRIFVENQLGHLIANSLGKS